MNNKRPIAVRMIVSIALLIIFAGLLTTTTVQSADPNAINATITVDPTSGLETTEASGQAIFTVSLSQAPAPSTKVTINLSSSNAGEGTVSPTSLVFNSGNWSPKDVTVTGVDDLVADGPVGYTIITSSAISTDPFYSGVEVDDVLVTNNDDDTAGYTITPNTDLWTSEGGASVKIQILLKSRPTSPVLLNFTSSNTDEGTVSPSSILVDPAVWPPTTPSEITITGVDDCKNDGGEAYTVTITATSSDPNYNGPVDILAMTNYDAPTISWVKPVEDEGIYISDGFSPIQLEVINLCNEPISKVRFYRWVAAIEDWVTIGEDLTPPYEEVLLPDELESGWNQVFAFAFGPPNPVQTFSKHKRILILYDTTGLTVVPTSTMQTSEAGGTASFTVALSTQPSADVTVAVSSSNNNEGIVSAPLILPLTFTTATWNITQPVTITGVDDLIVDNNVGYNIVLNPDSVIDTNYSTLPDTLVGITNIDRLTVINTPPMYTTEGDGTAKFTVALFRQPTTFVTISLSSDTQTEAKVTEPVSGSLTFTTLNWDTPQNITVTGKDDCDNDGDIPYKVTFYSTSQDSDFNKIESLDLINYDAPTIGWLKPVETEGIYISDGLSDIDLKVVSLCPEPIEHIKFTRWIAAEGKHESIGEDFDPPYKETLEADKLESPWTQVFAQAYGPPNEIQTFSKSERILILKQFDFLVHLPLVYK